MIHPPEQVEDKEIFSRPVRPKTAK